MSPHPDKATGDTSVGPAELQELPLQECLRLLGSVSLGRIGLLGSVPSILPVCHAVLDGDVVFRTDPGTKLSMADRGSLVVFEADEFDEQARTGWSVVVLGHAETVSDRATLERVDSLPIDPLITEFHAVVRIRSVRITGRTLGPPHKA